MMMLNRNLMMILLGIVGIAPTIIRAQSYEALLNHLYDKHHDALRSRFAPQLNMLCTQNSLDCKDSLNERRIIMPLLLHKLVTTSNALDGAQGGILKTAYFWHWKRPNPRHEILHLPDSTKLNRMLPPKEYSKYKSAADIDRYPAIFLGDMVSEKPKYFHKSCGAFYTFGWCSEREMAFTTVAHILGFEAKIKQADIHVWSEICIDLRKIDGSSSSIILTFDNTFDSFEWFALHKTMEQWKNDIGSGNEIALYNNTPHNSNTIHQVKSIKISEAVINRIDSTMIEWLKTNE